MALRIALFGQAAFAKDVLERLLADGHEIVGAYAPPQAGGASAQRAGGERRRAPASKRGRRPRAQRAGGERRRAPAKEGRRADPFAEEAEKRGVRLLRHRYFRRKSGEAIASRVEEWKGLGAELNVLAFVTVILPGEIVFAPPKQSLCFHPSLLPAYRGGSAIAWQIIEGERETGVTVFQPDEGVDTGPIVVQKGGVPIGPEDNAARLYYEKLYPLGVEAVVEAVRAVDAGTAEPTPQDESRASFQGLVDDEVARIDWSRDAETLDRLVRGCDPAPGAWARRGEDVVRLHDEVLVPGDPGEPPGTVLPGEGGRLLVAARGGRLSVGRVRVGKGGKVAAAESGIAPGERLA